MRKNIRAGNWICISAFAVLILGTGLHYEIAQAQTGAPAPGGPGVGGAAAPQPFPRQPGRPGASPFNPGTGGAPQPFPASPGFGPMMPPPSTGVAVTSRGDSIYVVANNHLYQFAADTLREVHRVSLEVGDRGGNGAGGGNPGTTNNP